ncbi:hypothetical protein HpRN195_02170 [Helicobacter pylori]
MNEPETSLEQNALIRLSNLISLRNTQQLTSIIATHDPIVLDSCEWVLFLKNGNIAQYKPLNSILKSVAKTFNFKEKPTTKDLLALLITKGYLMGAILSILKLEIKSYLTNTSALFWTFIYPILMLLLLIFVFSKNTTEIFYFNNIIGLMGLLIISSTIFGLTQAITSLRIA